MSRSRTASSLKPPPHANAETHRRIIEKLSAMTLEEIRETSIASGIHLKNGELAARYRSSAEADRAFLAENGSKEARERWVLDRWLTAKNRHPNEIKRGDTKRGAAPDFVVDGTGVEVVEAMRADRKRGDELKAKVKAAKAHIALVRRLPGVAEVEVRKSGHVWILDQVIGKRYDPSESSRWKLLVYANFFRADAVQWELLETKLIELRPRFASIDVLYHSIDSAAVEYVARTVFSA